jgi:hydroxymethylglutaryl-CoA lyase
MTAVTISEVSPRDGIQAIAQPIVPTEAKLALIRALHAAGLRRREIGLADTTGNAAPDQVGRVFRHAIRLWGPRFAFHGHDTCGMGVANVAAAHAAGCRMFDAAAGGIGGCPFAPGASGNVATEDVAWLFRRMGVATGIGWNALLAASDLAAALPGALPGGRMRGVKAARAA